MQESWGGVQGPLPHARGAELPAPPPAAGVASPGESLAVPLAPGELQSCRQRRRPRRDGQHPEAERTPLARGRKRWHRRPAQVRPLGTRTHARTHRCRQRTLQESLRTLFKPQSRPYRPPPAPETSAGTPGSDVPAPPGTWLSRSPPGRGRAGPAAASPSPPGAQAPRSPQNPPMGYRLPASPRPAAPSSAPRAAQRRSPAQ